MPIGSWKKPAADAANVVDPTPGVQSAQPVEGLSVSTPPAQPATPRKAVADAVTQDMARTTSEGKELENRVLSYREMLEAEGINLAEAERIVEAILIEGVYTETVFLTKNISVTFRSRTQGDYQRYLHALEVHQPRYQSEQNEILLRYTLAGSLVAYRGRTFVHPPQGELKAANDAHEERLAWIAEQPEVLIRTLNAHLYKFDRKVLACVREGMIENF